MISHDINSAQHDQTALRVLVEELEFLVANSPMGALFANNGILLRANPETAKLFAYADAREMIGMKTSDLFLSAQSYAEFGAAVSPILASNQLVDIRWPMRRKDGSPVMARLTGRSLPASRYEHGAIWMMEDITLHLRQEEELSQHRERLEQLVERRTAELHQAHHHLLQSEKMAALGSLVAGVAHELNTPIGTSITVGSTLDQNVNEMLKGVNSGLLRRSDFTQFLENSAQGIALLMRNLHRSASLISSFKQVAVDQTSNQRRSFDLQQLLDEVLTTLAPTYNATAYALTVDIETKIEMDSYPGALGQIIGGFVSNALAHAFEGRSQGSMVLASRLIDTETVEITFRDDGIGIDVAHQHRVFEPFFTTKFGKGGCGLGMSIVYNLVTGVLGGQIDLRSVVGHGTTFRLVLPRVAPKK